MDPIKEGFVWAIMFLPLGSFAIITLVSFLGLTRSKDGRPAPWSARYSGYLTILAILGSFLLSLWAFDSVADADGARVGFDAARMADDRPLQVNIGITLDGLTGGDARRRDGRLAAGADLLAGVHARRRGIQPLLRLHVAVHGVDAGPGAGVEHPPAVRVLGAGGPLLVPADRLLVLQGLGAQGRDEGVPGDAHRRPRLHDRAAHHLHEGGHAGHLRASTRRRSLGAIGSTCADAGSRSASSPARPASRRSSRCTSGCRTRWRARRRSPR